MREECEWKGRRGDWKERWWQECEIGVFFCYLMVDAGVCYRSHISVSTQKTPLQLLHVTTRHNGMLAMHSDALARPAYVRVRPPVATIDASRSQFIIIDDHVWCNMLVTLQCTVTIGN
jgi:hypothetical protein